MYFNNSTQIYSEIIYESIIATFLHPLNFVLSLMANFRLDTTKDKFIRPSVGRRHKANEKDKEVIEALAEGTEKLIDPVSTVALSREFCERADNLPRKPVFNYSTSKVCL